MMGMAWELDADRPIYAQLVERVQREIVSGQYRPGEKLPSVRDLAAVAAAQAGPVRPLADVGGGEKPGSGGQVTPARENDRVAETVLPGGAAHGAGEYAVFLGQLDHARTSR